ncbi:MAG: fatty acid desaturase, partial [Methyloceanibacter sp.]
NIFWVKGKIMEPIVNWLYLFQNFHLIHHLFPRVPFYLYLKAFRSLKPVLVKEHAHIYEFGHESRRMQEQEEAAAR